MKSMDFENRGALQLAALAGALLVLLGVIAVAGFAMADTSPTGEEVLSDVEDRYQSADSVLVEANVTVEQNDSVTEFSVHSVATSDGQMRTNVSNETGYLLVGHTENTTWVTGSETGATLVISSENREGQPPMAAMGNPALPGFRTTTVGPDNESLSVWVYGLENATFDSGPNGWNQSHDFGGVNVSMASVDWNESSDHPMADHWSGGASNSHNWSDVGPHADDLNTTYNAEEWENKSISTLLEETNLTAEFEGIETVDGHDAHVVVISHPEHEGQVKVWSNADTATVLKYRVSTPNETMTVTMEETRFNVSPAASTFQPPIASETERTSADSLSELRDAAPFTVGVPSDNWTFTGGSVIASPMEAVIGQYETNSSEIAVVQFQSRSFEGVTAEGRTVEVNDRNITVLEVAEGQMIARWSQNDQTVVVSGEVSESVLLDFVRDLEFNSSAP